MNRSTAIAWALLALPLAGCSSMPTPLEPPARPGGLPTGFRVGVAPVRIAFAKSELPKGYAVSELASPDRLGAEVARWVAARGRFAQVATVPGRAREERLRRGWELGSDLLLEVEVRGLHTRFDGHNNWWIPNVINWLFWIVPSFWVATEEYSLGLEAEARLLSVDSRAVLHTESFSISVEGTFDEFDRGWQPLGFLTPLNGPDNWRQIAHKLFPAARAQLAAQVSAWLSGADVLSELQSPAGRRRLRKTMALVVGISEYPDPIRCPRLPYASSDARALTRTLTASVGLEPRHVVELRDGAATPTGLKQALAGLGRRLRDEDQLVVYVAGYGARDPDGCRVVLLAGESAPQRLRLDRLAAALGALRGSKLVVLDLGFDGQGRSQGAPGGAASAGLAELAKQGTVLTATRPGNDLLTPSRLRASLFGYHLRRGLVGAADRDRDGRLSPTELFQLASRSVVAQAAYQGKTQRPQAFALGRAFSLPAGRAEETK